MKDEKMAEQFADNISGLELTCSVLASKDKNHAYRLGRYEGYLAGLKAGRPQWHDLRKDPNDLPKEKCNVLDKNGNTLHYDSGYFYKEYIFCTKEYPIAWCEIPTFDEEQKKNE